jgi:hypothetical protein
MKIAKRTLRISKRSLEELFGLPEGVEILAVTPSKHVNNEYEFTLVSAGEVMLDDERKLTCYQDDELAIYRPITLDTLNSVKAKTKNEVTEYVVGKEMFVLDDKQFRITLAEQQESEIIIPLETTRTHPKTEEEKRVHANDLVNNILNKLKDGGEF